MDEREASIEQARLKLGEIVDRARLADQFTTITRQGHPAAVVVNVDWYQDAKALLAKTDDARPSAARKAATDAHSEDGEDQS